MKKKELLYEGKAKKVYTTDQEALLIVEYKDDATAFNGEKKGSIAKKGIVNNVLSNHLMKMLEAEGIPTHYIEELNQRETVVKKVQIIPLEVIVRNIAAGSLSRRLGVEEGTVMKRTVLEFSYKNDDLGDPMVNEDHIYALELATKEDVAIMRKYAFKINDLLIAYLKKVGITLVDFKIEFGKTKDGTLILADEISPDTCRFWDSQTGKKLDKDRFRQDLGHVEEVYQEVMNRLFR